MSVYSRTMSEQRGTYLVVDDYHLDAGGPEYRAAIICFFVICSVSGFVVLAKDGRWRHGLMGGFRTTPRVLQNRPVLEASPEVPKVDERNFGVWLCAHVSFRGRLRTRDVRRRGFRV